MGSFRRVSIAGLMVVALAGCSAEPPTPRECSSQFPGPYDGELELSIVDAAGSRRLIDGDSVGANGLFMIVPSLRAEGIDPRAPDTCVEVTVLGHHAAADLAGMRTNMVADGAGYVLRNVQVAFHVGKCCVDCREGLVDAYMRDNRGRQFHRQLRVQLDRGGCPDVPICCQPSDECPAPELMGPACP